MFKNNISSLTIKKDIYRKSLVVMLYAHYEGFTKMCFSIYIKFVNSLNLKRINIRHKPELIASSMNKVFKKYDDKDRKNELFKRSSQDDKSIHSIYRRADLINGFNEYLEEIIEIDDDVINTESNLWSHVLEKNFYKLGIKHDIFKASYKDIDKLVNLRNSIAHGSEKRGINEKFYDHLEKTIIKNTMERLILIFSREAKILTNN